jgi:hypothetical protein
MKQREASNVTCSVLWRILILSAKTVWPLNILENSSKGKAVDSLFS